MNLASSSKIRIPSVIQPRAARATVVLVGLTGLLLLMVLLSVSIGAVKISPLQTMAILLSQIGIDLNIPFETQQAAVLTAIRLPRVILGVLVGAGLAVAGAAMQGLFRNPLADPGLIGVSSGAALAAVTMIVLGSSFGLLSGLQAGLGLLALPFAAFVGGLATTLLIYRLSSVGGRVAVATMLLAGIAIAALSGACTGLLTFVASDAQLRSITFWSLGSLGGATWNADAAVAPFLLLAIMLIPRYARALNAMLLGESEAGHLGVNVERVKRIVIVLTALCVGASVAVTGIIGFVGLIVPHLLRGLIGPDHRFVLPGAVLLGSSLLLGADLIARTIVSPAELPIGIVTAILGAPFFLWLLLKGRRLSA